MALSPYFQSERHFRLYEPYLAKIVDAWPQAVTFTPQPPVASVETLSTRIRICREALRNNIQSNEDRWPTSIPTAKFLQVCDEIVVSTTVHPGKVVCGPIETILAIRASSQQGQGTPSTTSTPTPLPIYSITSTHDGQVIPIINLIDPDLQLIEAVLTLHHYRVMSEPSRITITDLQHSHHDKIAAFAKAHDIAISRLDNTYTII